MTYLCESVRSDGMPCQGDGRFKTDDGLHRVCSNHVGRFRATIAPIDVPAAVTPGHHDCSAIIERGTKAGMRCTVTASYISDDGRPLCGWHRGKATRRLEVTAKRCRDCQEVKPLAAFNRSVSRTSVGQRQSYCRACEKLTRDGVKVSPRRETAKAAHGCNICRSQKHSSADCPARGKGRIPCSLCAGLPHRVAGLRCRGCGLRRGPEPELHAIDFAVVRNGPTYPEGPPRLSRTDAVEITKRMDRVINYVKRPTHANEVRALDTNVVNPFFKDETGKRYGTFTVVQRSTNYGAQARWLLRCDCGAEVVITGHSLRAGKRLGKGVKCAVCAKARRARAS